MDYPPKKGQLRASVGMVHMGRGSVVCAVWAVFERNFIVGIWVFDDCTILQSEGDETPHRSVFSVDFSPSVRYEFLVRVVRVCKTGQKLCRGWLPYSLTCIFKENHWSTIVVLRLLSIPLNR